jgi:hypothetical protein
MSESELSRWLCTVTLCSIGSGGPWPVCSRGSVREMRLEKDDQTPRHTQYSDHPSSDISPVRAEEELLSDATSGGNKSLRGVRFAAARSGHGPSCGGRKVI